MVDIAVLTVTALIALGITYALGVRRGRAFAQGQREVAGVPADPDVGPSRGRRWR